MTVLSRIFWSAVVGGATMGMTHALSGQEPARLGVDQGPSPRIAVRGLSPQVPVNQRLASSIAEHLRQSGQLRHYNINVAFQDGIAELSGNVIDQSQREEAVRLVQGVPGVECVRDFLTLTGAANDQMPVAQAQALAPRLQEPGPMPKKNPLAPPNGASTEPLPIFQAPAPGPYDVTQPKMPPYAWPTYAPYNNYSRVAYPQLYPYNSWPYIGPNYPFPKIPLGWRKVQLEWKDGCWWYGNVGNSHDWWRLRYW